MGVYSHQVAAAEHPHVRRLVDQVWVGPVPAADGDQRVASEEHTGWLAEEIGTSPYEGTHRLWTRHDPSRQGAEPSIANERTADCVHQGAMRRHHYSFGCASIAATWCSEGVGSQQVVTADQLEQPTACSVRDGIPVRRCPAARGRAARPGSADRCMTERFSHAPRRSRSGRRPEARSHRRSEPGSIKMSLGCSEVFWYDGTTTDT